MPTPRRGADCGRGAERGSMVSPRAARGEEMRWGGQAASALRGRQAARKLVIRGPGLKMEPALGPGAEGPICSKWSSHTRPKGLLATPRQAYFRRSVGSEIEHTT